MLYKTSLVMLASAFAGPPISDEGAKIPLTKAPDGAVSGQYTTRQRLRHSPHAAPVAPDGSSNSVWSAEECVL